MLVTILTPITGRTGWGFYVTHNDDTNDPNGVLPVSSGWFAPRIDTGVGEGDPDTDETSSGLNTGSERSGERWETLGQWGFGGGRVGNRR